MTLNLFHFSHVVWLWGLLIIPGVFIFHVLFQRRRSVNHLLERFADKELLPHLIKNPKNISATWKNRFLIWSPAWLFGIMAMAGPQWRYTDVQLFKPSKDLVILLDLSSSMNASDLKPSRLVRAREEISDLLDMNHGLSIGLVAYAKIPHMVVPLTDDMHTIHNLLPSLDTSLITIDGDRLKPALEMASRMLGAEPGHNKSILVVSDGDFSEGDMEDLAAAAKGTIINTMGVGTDEGAPIPNPDGGWSKDQSGHIIIDRLHNDKLQALSAAGHGVYVQAVYDNSDTLALLNHIDQASDDALVGGKTIRTWDEGFYIPALIVALLLLPWFRKGMIFFVFAILISTPCHNAQAASIKDWLYNPEQQGLEEFEAGHYDEASKKFSDPYQQAVAAYKAGQFAKAADLFKAAATDKNSDLAAEYNLGNAQMMQNNPEDAITSYETVLKHSPDDASAQHNLALAKKMLEQKKQQQQSQDSKSQEGKQGEQSNGAGQGEESNQQKSEQGNQSDKSQPHQAEKSAQSSQDQKAQNNQDKSQGQQPSQQQDKDKAPQQPGQKKGGQAPNQQSAAQTQQQKEQQQGEETGASSTEEKSAEPKEPAQNQPTGEAQANSADNRDGQPNDQATAVHPRTQLDINVDQWLNHIQSDPGSFLKNQFMIEEKKSSDGQEE